MTAILIDEKGKVADCTVTQTSGLAALDSQTCFIITSRAKFVPAVGADGNPAKHSMSPRIQWKMP